MKLRRTLSLSLMFSAALFVSVGGLLSQQPGGTGVGETAPTSPNIDRDEIRSPRVNFVNRNNTPFTEPARQQEIQSGTTLATDVVSKNEASARGITIKRVFDKDKPGYGADLIMIEPKSDIGHINRIQRMLVGYLMKAFEYNRQDAEVVSRFVLYYNANNRRNVDLIKTKYSEDVLSAVDAQKLGIDRTYRNWAGRTQIVLPLRKSAVRPGETDLNNNEIKDETKNVKKNEQKEFDKVAEDRKKDEQKKLADKDEELKKQQKDLADEAKRLKDEQDRAKKEKEDTGKRLQELRNDPNADPQEVKKTEEAAKKVEEKTQEVAKKQEQVQQKQQEVAKKQEEVKQQQAEVAKPPAATTQTTAANTTQPQKTVEQQQKIEQLQKENDELKKQQEQKEQISENVLADKILFMRVLRYTTKGHYQNELWFIDAKNDDTLKRSTFTRICSRDFVVVDKAGVLVTGYRGDIDDPSDHHLVLLDAETLEKARETEERVYWDTPMRVMEGKIYAFIEKSGEHYLARFDQDLKLEATSSDAISPYSEVTFFKDKIYITGKPRTGDNTTIQVFNKADLKRIKTIEPPASPAN